MSEWPPPRRCRGGREHAQTSRAPVILPCARPHAGASPRPDRAHEWLTLDNCGRLLLAPAVPPPADLDEHARALCAALGEILSRPIELLSACANPLGNRSLVSVATREVGRSGPVLRTAAARGSTVTAALLEAVATAHLGTDSVLRAAAERLAEDGVITSGLLVEAGVERWFGNADRSGPLPHLITGLQSGTHLDVALDLRTRALRLGPSLLAVTVPDETAARLFDLWSSAVTRRIPEPTSGVGTRS